MTQDKQKAKGSLRSDQDQLIFGKGFSFSGYERDPLYLNLGSRKFVDISGCSGIDSVTDGRAAVFADFDNDGDLDVFMTTLQTQPHLMFRNNIGQDRRFLRVVLDGGAAGRDAFSAVVRMQTSAGTLTKVKAGGSGYVSQNDPRLLFGLGDDPSVDAVEVTWPGGAVERFGGPFAAGSTLKLVRGSGRAETLKLAAARLPDPLTAAESMQAGLRVAVGAVLPELPVTRLDGSRVRLRALARPGRRLLVNVWATWCVPCRKEMPELEARRERLAAAGIDLVGLSVDTEPDAPVAAFAGARVRYPVVRIEPSAMGRLYATDEVTVPLSLLVDAEGRVSELIPGWSDAARRRLDSLVGGPPDATTGATSTPTPAASPQAVPATPVGAPSPTRPQDEPAAPASPVAAAPARRVEPIGDFRYRHETTDFAAAGSATRNRERLRLRAGLVWRADPQLTVTAQLQTGERDDPKSPHSTLGNAFRTLPLNLALASATWQPARAPGLRLTAGKFASPLVVNPVYGEMVWDADLRPEGAVASWSYAGRGRVGGTAAYYIVQERAADDDAGALVAQGFARAKLGRAETTLALAYYGLDRTTSRRPGTLLPLAPGNVTLDSDGDGTPDRFASDFHLWHPLAALQIEAAGRPLVLAGEYVRNAAAVGGQGDAFGIGLAFGRLRRPGEWQAYYQYLSIEPDAVFALVSQDDLTRATNLRGHLFGGRLQVMDKASLHAWVLAAEPHSGGDGLDWRLRLDLNVGY